MFLFVGRSALESRRHSKPKERGNDYMFQKAFPSSIARSLSSGSSGSCEGINCQVCVRDRPRSDNPHTYWRTVLPHALRVDDTRNRNPEHTRVEDECTFAQKHIIQKRRGAKAGTIAPLPGIAENDNDEHGAPLALDQETALYTNESEDVVRPEQTANFNPPRQDPRYVDLEGPTPPPPPHPRHLARQQVENIMEEASTRAFDEDTPSWSTFDIGTAMTS